MDGITELMDMHLGKFWVLGVGGGGLGREAWCAVVHGVADSDTIEQVN